MAETHSPDVIIVGGGQAGISLSYYLQKLNIPHLVLERDRPFSSWHNRWDGFQANTPSWMNTLPMLGSGRLPSKRLFATKQELIDYFEDTLKSFDPPVLSNCNVEKVTRQQNGNWEVRTTDKTYTVPYVAICNGAMSTPRIPQFAGKLHEGVPQLHSSAYRGSEQINTKSVLVVGSGSSGVQICRLLSETGRFDNLYLSVSNVMLLPPSLFGVQIHRFLHLFGLFDVRCNSLIGKMMYSNLETKGDPILPPSPKTLAKTKGIKLTGRLTDVEEDGASLRFADGNTLDTDDLTVLWCTGFSGDYTFIETGNREAAFPGGYPKHRRGVVDAAPGLYFVGLRYQHTVASHDIYGVAKDAEYVAGHIKNAWAAKFSNSEKDIPANDQALEFAS